MLIILGRRKFIRKLTFMSDSTYELKSTSVVGQVCYLRKLNKARLILSIVGLCSKMLFVAPPVKNVYVEL